MGRVIWLLCALPVFVFSQSKIEGFVIDSDSNLGIFAYVILKNEEGKIVTYTNTDNEGFFRLVTDEEGDFTIHISSLSYDSQIKKVNLSASGYFIENFKLVQKMIELNEVILEANKPIIVENDKIVFDANHFSQGNEQVVEDLLRKIPGISIDSNGTIKIGNQEVEKVMVDGDDFFDRGYKILTKNMPVTPLDKIEVLKNYSNNKLLKGIENSDKVALNLTLKEDAKNIWFGNLQAGFDLLFNKRYESKGNLMNFGKNSKHYYLANLNNIGLNPAGDINHLIRPYRINEPASIGDNQSVFSLVGLNFETPSLKQKRVNLNNAKMISLNSIFNLNDNLKIKTLGYLNSDGLSFYKKSLQQFSVLNTSFTNEEDFFGQRSVITGFGKIDISFTSSENQSFEYTGKFNHSKENNRSDLLFNNDILNERLYSRNQLIDQKFVYTVKYNESKVFLLSGRYINEKSPQSYQVNNFILDDIFNVEADNTMQLSENKMQFAGLEAHWLLRRKRGDLFEVKLGNQLRLDQLNTQFELLNHQNIVSLPNDFQNQFHYYVNDLYISSKYQLKWNTFSFLTQLETHQLFNQISNKGVDKTQTPLFFVPKVGIDWKVSEKNRIISSYTHTTTNATIIDTYSGFVQTNFRSFSKGLEEFNQLNASYALLNYTYGSWSDKLFVNSYLIFSKNNDFFSTNSFVAQNYNLSETIIIQDRKQLSFYSNVDRYFKYIKSNLKINLGITQSNFKNIVNNSNLREVTSLNADYGFEMRSGFNGFFNYHIGSSWFFNQIKTSITNSFTDNLTFFDLSFLFSDNFNIDVKTERYFFGNLDKNINRYYFLDIEARYVLKQNKITLFASANNLLNTNTFRNYSISDIYILQAEYRLMPRYLLLKVEYRF